MYLINEKQEFIVVAENYLVASTKILKPKILTHYNKSSQL